MNYILFIAIIAFLWHLNTL